MDLAVALEQLKRIEHGGSSSLLVRGEAGIGKTRLALEIVSRARGVGHGTVTGRANEFDRGIPYALIRDVLAGLPDTGGPLRTRLVALREGLDAAAPAGGAPPDAHLSLVYERAVEVFRALTTDASTVLVVEDVHLADADSLALLTLLARLGELPMLLVATMRPAASGPSRDFERLLERRTFDGLGAVVDLEPLDWHEVQALAGAALDAVPDGRVVDAAFTRSGGNPFFARETMRALPLQVEGGRARLLAQDDVHAPNPPLLDRVFGGDDEALALAKVISAFGRFTLRHLPLAARLAGADEAAVASTFDRLVHEHVLLRDGAFAHGIVRDAVYEAIGPAERRRLHAAIARELALAGDRRSGATLDIAELATHVAESADPGDEWALEILLEAGRTVSATAPLVAAEHYRHATALLPGDSPRRAGALALQARALHIGSRPLDAAAIGREALADLPQGPQRRATVSIVVDGLVIAGRVAEALEVVEAELEAGGAGCPLLAQRAHLLFSAGRPADAEALAGPAVAALEAAEPAVGIVAAIHLVVYAWDAGDVELAERMHALLDAMTETGPPTRRMLAHETIALHDRRPGIVATMERHLAARRRLNRNPSLPSIGGTAELAQVYLHQLRAEWDAALELARSVGFDLEQRGVLIVAYTLRTAEAEILVYRGAVDEASAILRALTPPTEELILPTELARARVHRALGDAAGAIDVLRRERERSAAARTTWLRAEALCELAELLHETGEAEEAADVAAEVAALASSPCRFEWPLAALRLQTVLTGDADAGRAYLERASLERLPFERARAQLALGELGVEPREHLVAAHRTFDDLDAGPWRRRAANAMKAAGLSAPRAAARAGETLTETEERLVALVCDGLTNRQIAAALHYSPKTVEVYLSRIYAKTRCASRVELVRAHGSAGSTG